MPDPRDVSEAKEQESLALEGLTVIAGQSTRGETDADRPRPWNQRKHRQCLQMNDTQENLKGFS